MGFLIKTAFWLSLVLLVIPFGGTGEGEGQATVGPVDTFFAARAVIDDVSGLCERRPETCEFGREALHTIGVRAREGARIAYGMLDGNLEEPQQLEDSERQPIHTGSVPVPQQRVEPAGDRGEPQI